MIVKTVALLWAVLAVAHCEPYPRFEFNSSVYLNNTYINRRLIGVSDSALKCVTNNTLNCCTGLDDGGWTDEAGEAVQEGPSGSRGLYITRGSGVVNLNREYSGSAGMWQCDILNFDGVKQNIYIYTGVPVDVANGELYE